MKPRVVAVGEILWDLLPDGRQLGGAPANVAHHARALGAEALLVTRVGRDAPGDEAAERLRRAGFPLDTLQRDPDAPTGSAGVRLDADGQPRFEIATDVAWDRLEADPAARGAVARAKAICFGTLAQRSPASRAAIRALIEAAPREALRVLDVNWRPPFGSRELFEGSLACAGVAKLSEHELDLARDFFGLPADPSAALAELARRFRLRLVALTRGERGSLLFADGRCSDHPGVPVAVRDAVGAGDAFTAALTLGLLRGDPLDAINRRANAVAAYVCTQPGATPELPPGLNGIGDSP